MDLATNSLGSTQVVVTQLGFGGAPLGGVGDGISDQASYEILRLSMGERHSVLRYRSSVRTRPIGKTCWTVSSGSEPR